MKHLLALTIACVPLTAQASFGPDITTPYQPEVHLSDQVRPSVLGEIRPSCTDPTPQQIVFACAVTDVGGK